MAYRLRIRDGQLQQALESFLRGYSTTAERVSAVRTALDSPAGKFWRNELAKWTVLMVPVEELVPEAYAHWRPLVRDAMMFVVSHLSAARLAPKVVEQAELSPDTPNEARLLRFIARVPGLQKIGQVLARNHNMDPRFRRALAELENGITDVGIEEIRAIIFEQLKPQIKSHQVKLNSSILSEASVSAVVGFSWRNPESGRRERGVFKVLKPHIPACYAEDMKIIQQLAGYLARKHRAGGVRLAGVSETLTEIRLLLEREVDFRREQHTLLTCLGVYRSVPGVRVPRLIPPLSTDTITALTREDGAKVTEVVSGPARERRRLAEKLAEALVAVPVLAWEKESIFHADPHPGNLLYDSRRKNLVILDWALTERLARQQRKNVLMLVLMLMLRDAEGAVRTIERLRQHGGEKDGGQARIIRERVTRILNALPLFQLPGPMEAMRLLDEVALEGIRFPAALLMFRKATFTLDGVLEDIAGSNVRIDSAVARYAAAHWLDASATLFSLLSLRDWLEIDGSALTFAARFCAQALSQPWRWIPRLLASSAAR